MVNAINDVQLNKTSAESLYCIENEVLGCICVAEKPVVAEVNMDIPLPIVVTFVLK